jgi:hypothetical protein
LPAAGTEEVVDGCADRRAAEGVNSGAAVMARRPVGWSTVQVS